LIPQASASLPLPISPSQLLGFVSELPISISPYLRVRCGVSWSAGRGGA
jgi:hypothetical protein